MHLLRISSRHKSGDKHMKKFAVALSAAAFTMLTYPAFAASPGVERTYVTYEPNPQVIGQLQEAEEADLRDARDGNKNNPAFGQKAYQVNQLIDRLQAGDQVAPEEIQDALQPVHVW
jgi:hypothetical protein